MGLPPGVATRLLQNAGPLNRTLEESVMAQMSVDPGTRKSAMNALGGGLPRPRPSWRSVEMSLFERPGLRELLALVQDMAPEGTSFTVGWALYHPKGGLNMRHNHLPRKASIVYYVAVPGPPAALILYDGEREHRVEPEPGLAVRIPGGTEHRVEESRAEGARISIIMDFG